ncbi:thioredoxin domain-containing protein [Stappia sp. 28M-7]|uniref:thioredoxin domain-containing protein n=1 Tax=Stappia sp. 28M-7 TaxID=2762596 RepID=UPI00163B93B6|nr:thioredoxin domain-containing protein [Stappia sp. 28M-7]MBC2861556.1 thioredoxin domain-containing protein [Stappia sp. 28M-7]
MTDNRLADATSPYLLQHKDNPVAWRPWGPEALAEARATDKPILLSVGYAACHWCHVMAHESFEDPDVAEVMNRLFVNIKVDREERPDIDQIYMSALHALGEQGGWPLTMFLTSEAEPFWGGTYFPKTARWGRPGFTDVLEAIAGMYRTDRGRIDTNRKALMDHLRKAPLGATARLPSDLPITAGQRLAGLYDKTHGGIHGAPKFPQACVSELVWRTSLRTGDAEALRTCILTLERMSNGGIYDHIGGGLARYSVDERWLVPHFEKMLYDNAQYISHLARALALPGLAPPVAELFRTRLDETVAWLQREMMNGPAFAASLDADSEGEEGRFYVWTPNQVAAVLGETEEALLFCEAYDITAPGNFEGSSIPNRLIPPEDDGGDVLARFAQARHTLLAARETRVRPGRDDKVLADWNGLMIAGLAEAEYIFRIAGVSRESWRRLAVGAYRFVMEEMRDDTGRMAHAWRDGRSTRPGFASDLAMMMKAAIALAETSASISEANRFLTDAKDLAAQLDRDFAAEGGGYYLSSVDAGDVILRPLSPMDEAVPNANGVAAEALQRLWHLTGDQDAEARSEAIVTRFGSEIAGNVFGTASLLSAMDTGVNALLAVLVVPVEGDASDSAMALRRAVAGLADPAVLRLEVPTGHPFPAGHPMEGKSAKDGRPTLYLCRQGACSAPVTEAADIEAALVQLLGPRTRAF